MAPAVVDMSDKNAWEDSTLIDHWNECVKQYEKYHSIHKSGKRLEEALTEEELKELRADYADVLEEPDSIVAGDLGFEDDAMDEGNSDVDDIETNEEEPTGQEQAEYKELQASEQHQPAPKVAPEAHDEARASTAMPQAILGTVQDENLKNMMMSWYYAGYYTGLHAAQQQALQDSQPKKP